MNERKYFWVDDLQAINVSNQALNERNNDSSLPPEQMFQLGQRYVEGGQYREAVRILNRAVPLAGSQSRLGGELQLWLVTAYDASGQKQDAIQLCRKLTQHSHWTIRKQSKRVLYILEAPKLTLKPEWVTQIPDLDEVQGQRSVQRGVSSTTYSPENQGYKINDQPVDLTAVQTQEPGFILFALVIVSVVFLGLFWIA